MLFLFSKAMECVSLLWNAIKCLTLHMGFTHCIILMLCYKMPYTTHGLHSLYNFDVIFNFIFSVDLCFMLHYLESRKLARLGFSIFS